jgi:hypothetical protein
LALGIAAALKIQNPNLEKSLFNKASIYLNSQSITHPLVLYTNVMIGTEHETKSQSSVDP